MSDYDPQERLKWYVGHDDYQGEREFEALRCWQHERHRANELLLKLDSAEDGLLKHLEVAQTKERENRDLRLKIADICAVFADLDEVPKDIRDEFRKLTIEYGGQ